MEGNSFSNNSVDDIENTDESLKEETYGGAVYFTCDGSTENCKVTMQQNYFLNNTSSRSGGAIKWDDIEPENLEEGSNVF